MTEITTNTNPLSTIGQTNTHYGIGELGLLCKLRPDNFERQTTTISTQKDQPSTQHEIDTAEIADQVRSRLRITTDYKHTTNPTVTKLLALGTEFHQIPV